HVHLPGDRLGGCVVEGEEDEVDDVRAPVGQVRAVAFDAHAVADHAGGRLWAGEAVYRLEAALQVERQLHTGFLSQPRHLESVAVGEGDGLLAVDRPGAGRNRRAPD